MSKLVKRDSLKKVKKAISDPFGFEGQSKLYSMYRQNHPLIYVEKAANSVKTKNIMLDVGCGTGQLWKPFSPIFQKIYGIDVSDSQLATARDAIQDLTNISFHNQNSHDISLFNQNEMEGKKIDLVTFGQVFHWLDHNVIFKHYKQFISAGGALAIFSYSIPRIVNSEVIDSIVKEQKTNSLNFDTINMSCLINSIKWDLQGVKSQQAFSNYYNLIRPHFDHNRDHVDFYFKHIDFQQYFPSVERHLYYDVKEISVYNFEQYLKTVSGYWRYINKFPQEEDPLKILSRELRNIYEIKETDDELAKTKCMNVLYPFFLCILKY